MKINFRKISAIASSALMVGMSVGMAAAANYPAPFVSGGTANVAVVYGTGEGVSVLDAVEAGNIQTNLQANLGGSGTSTTTTTTGDSKILSTSARKLYYGDGINAPISSLSYTELGEVLADGTFTDLSGTAYDYTQTLILGDTVNAFGTSGGDFDDPILYLDVGTTATDPLYNYTLSLTKNLNVSDSTNVQGQKIKILGINYVIGASSTNTTLYLYGSGETLTVNGGEEATITVAETEHKVSLVTTADSTHGTINVDGTQKSVVEGSNYAFPGGVNVYVKDIIHPAFAGDLRQAELIIGANSLKLQNGQTAKQGADETTIKGTNVVIAAAGSGLISGLTLQVAAAKSKEDSIKAGESFTDPVFGGLKFTFAGETPALDSTARGKVIIDTDNNQFAYVTFTSAKAGTAGEERLTYVYDNATSSSTVQPLLAHSTLPNSNGRGVIHVLEGEDAREDDWIVINQGDSGTILEVSDISITSGTAGTVTFLDVITGVNQEVTLTNSSNVYGKSGFNMFGGTGYTISANGAGTTVNITWSASGTRTLFPRIKLANGGWIALLTETTVANGTNIIFPDGQTSLTASGTKLQANGTDYVQSTNPNGITWQFRNATGDNVKVYATTSPACNFNSTYGPAVLFIEPKKWDDSSYGNFICTPLTTTGTTEIKVDDPVFNGTNSGFVTLGSDTYTKQAVDKYGSFVTKEDATNENGVATIAYPSSQMYFDVVASADTASITAGSTTSGSSTPLGDVLVKDSEISSVSTKNLIIVGGSCINSAAATVLGGAYCEEEFTTATGIGSGQFIIKGYTDATIGGDLVLLVAGYNAADTQNAATYLRTKTVDTSKEYKGTSATTAELVTTTTATTTTA